MHQELKLIDPSYVPTATELELVKEANEKLTNPPLLFETPDEELDAFYDRLQELEALLGDKYYGFELDILD